MFEFYILLGMAVIVVLGVLFSYWWCNSREYPKIKYKTWLKYYKLNPDRWHCYWTEVSYDLFHGGHQSFNFGLIDFYRYYLRNRRIKKAKQRVKRDEAMKRFLDDINETEVNNVPE